MNIYLILLVKISLNFNFRLLVLELYLIINALMMSSVLYYCCGAIYILEFKFKIQIVIIIKLAFVSFSFVSMNSPCLAAARISY